MIKVSLQIDWCRESITHFGEPNKQLLKSIRTYQHLSKHSGAIYSFRRKIWVLGYRFWSLVTGVDISLNSHIGAGAKIIGSINSGGFTSIGANAVVTKDVPAYAIVAGIPAKVIGSTKDDVDGE